MVAAVVAWAVLSAVAEAQPQPRRRPRPQPQDERAAAPEPAASRGTTEDGEDEEKPPRYLAVVNGTVHTVSGPVIRGATVLSKNGVIEAIGPAVKIPEGAEVIDAAGHHVYPGLVAVESLGLVGTGDPADSTDPFNLNMALGLAAGITTTVSRNDAAKLSFGTLEGHALASGVFETIRYDSRDPQNRRRVRQGLEAVRRYLAELAEYELVKGRDPSATKPDDSVTKGPNAAYVRLLKGEATALTNADSADDILAVVELAQRFGFRLVVRGAQEGWVVADRLGDGDIAAVVNPRARADGDDRLNRPNGASIENAAMLARAGVTVAVLPGGTSISLGGLAGRDLLNLNLEAAFAVRGGMSTPDAIRTVTLDAARIIGQEGRIGSIEVGKDADLVITDGPLLHYLTLARYTVVNGVVAYDRLKDPLLSHIRPEGKLDYPTPNDFWPRRLGSPQQGPGRGP